MRPQCSRAVQIRFLHLTTGKGGTVTRLHVVQHYIDFTLTSTEGAFKTNLAGFGKCAGLGSITSLSWPWGQTTFDGCGVGFLPEHMCVPSVMFQWGLWGSRRQRQVWSWVWSCVELGV